MAGSSKFRYLKLNNYILFEETFYSRFIFYVFGLPDFELEQVSNHFWWPQETFINISFLIFIGVGFDLLNNGGIMDKVRYFKTLFFLLLGNVLPIFFVYFVDSGYLMQMIQRTLVKHLEKLLTFHLRKISLLYNRLFRNCQIFLLVS